MAIAKINSLHSSSVAPLATKRDSLIENAYRRIGTLVQDEWRMKAYTLAERNGISVFPIKGWWAFEGNEKGYEPVRFSIVATLKTKSDNTELYNEALNKARIENALLNDQVISVHP